MIEARYDNDNLIEFKTYGGSMTIRYHGNGTVVTLYSGWTPSTATWYYPEIEWNVNGTNTLRIIVDGTPQDSSQASLTQMSTDPNTFRIGVITGTSDDLHVDQVLISRDPSRDINAIKDLTSFPD